MIEIESHEGTRREGPPFPIKSHTKSQESMARSYTLRRKGRKNMEEGEEDAWLFLFFFCPAHSSQGRAPALLWPPGHATHSQCFSSKSSTKILNYP